MISTKKVVLALPALILFGAVFPAALLEVLSITIPLTLYAVMQGVFTFLGYILHLLKGPGKVDQEEVKSGKVDQDQVDQLSDYFLCMKIQ